MAIPKQEKRFDYKGFPCVILFMPFGYRCGYVGVPDGTTVNTDEIECHGGVTYTSSKLYHQDDTGKLWIGFDCGHCFDGYDTQKIEEYYADDESVMKQLEIMRNYYKMTNEEQQFRTLEYCEEQCKCIVKQLIERGIEI